MDNKIRNSRRIAAIRLIPLLTIIGAAVLGYAHFGEFLTFTALQEHRADLIAFRDANYPATAAAFIGLYAVMVALSLPGATIATLTGGFLFSVFPGTLFNMIAATIGACGIFLAARLGFGERLAARLDDGDGAVKRIKMGIDENQWSMLFLMRLMPIVPFFVANLLPSFLGVSLGRFAVSTFFGIIPGAIVYTSLGAGLGSVFENGEMPDLGIIFQPQILLPILGLCLLAALPLIMRYVRRGRA